VSVVVRRITGPEVLTRAEVAHVLGVHPSTVTRWAVDGLLRHFRTPTGERRYRRRDVQDFLNRPRPERLAPRTPRPREPARAR
jgi:excisionase family DNA binding protein